MNEVRPIRTSAEQAFASAFHAAKDKLPGGAEVARLREGAFAAFADAGLPHRRIEEWKYTDLRTLMRDAPPRANPADAAAVARVKRFDPFAGVDLARLVMVNGAFVSELSDLKVEQGVTARPLARALADGDALVARIGGVLIEVAEGVSVERPIYLRHVFMGAAPAATFARVLFVVGKGASATLVESFEGPDGIAYQVNSAVELHVADGANVSLVRFQADGTSALHLSTLLAEIGAGAEVLTCALTTGAAVSRHSATLRIAGRRTNLRVAGAMLLRDRQHGDTTLIVDHAVPDGASREMFRTVLDAQKTDARMSLGALLLAEGAEADQKPELEIFADDVQCGHGATSGALDEQQLFYLMARGIPRKRAEALLIEAFFGEALGQVAHEGLRNVLLDRAVGWLRARENMSP
jgi:Fe-S cluster assembly protein SufD